MNATLRSVIVGVSAMSGIVGPVLFAIVVIDLGYRWIGYDPLTQTISELGARNAPNMDLQALNFGVLGTLTIIFAMGLTIHNRLFKSTSILVGVYGIGTSLVAFLPCDPGCPAGGISAVQLDHSLDALISFVTLAFAPLHFWRASRTVPSWIKMSLWSLLVASVSIPLLFVYLAIEVFSLSPYTGLFQRIFFGLLFAWIIVIAVQLLRLRDISLPPVLGKSGQ